ncbi:hypothetical protein SLE2022_391640 [Rubroshorea leprosula]
MLQLVHYMLAHSNEIVHAHPLNPLIRLSSPCLTTRSLAPSRRPCRRSASNHSSFTLSRSAAHEAGQEHEVSLLTRTVEHRANKSPNPVRQPNTEGGVMLGLGPTPS